LWFALGVVLAQHHSLVVMEATVETQVSEFRATTERDGLHVVDL
jgi:hypothetical protein